MEKAANGQTLVVADQNESLDFTYVEDTVKGVMSVLNNSSSLNETFNISRGESRTILDLAKLITKYYPKSKIQIGGNVEFMPGLERPKRGSLNINKARELLNYEPAFDLEAGIEEYVKFWNKTY
jgi:nucleoside-diphosphate-sugar epimerase